MSDAEKIEELRRLFLTAPEFTVTRILAVVISLVLFGFVLWLVRKRTLREELTPIWIGVVSALLVLSVWPPLLYGITRAIGAWSASSTIFFLGELFLVAICLHYGTKLSKTNLQIKNLAQETALLRATVKELQSRVESQTPPKQS